MPVTPSFLKPKNPRELNDKILNTPPGEEHLIPEYVKTHLKEKGHAIYKHTAASPVDVSLTSAECIVFLIGGKFMVGGEEVSKRGHGHLLENEETIQLQGWSIVVIIDRL